MMPGSANRVCYALPDNPNFMHVMNNQSNSTPFIFFILLLAVAGSSCSNNDTTTSTEQIQPVKETPSSLPHIAFRTGITSDNAYSDLFIDSARLEQFIQKHQVENKKANDIRNFYNNRAFQFAWFNSLGFTEQALAFRSLYDYSKDSTVNRKSLDNRLDALLNTDSLLPDMTDPVIVSTEMLMTWRFINYLDDAFSKEKTKYAALTGMVPYQKLPAASANTDNNNIIIIAKKNTWLINLQKALEQLLIIQQKGGWENLPLSLKLYPKKKASTRITQLKKRLQVTGQLDAADTTQVYTNALREAIKKAQAEFGYLHDTILTVQLLRELNTPVDTRIQQVRINLERMKWMPDLPEREYILVNIPEFRLHVMEGNDKKLDMNIITGKEGHGTVMFSGDLNQIVFNPYWNLPASIVEKEIIPAIEKNRHYLEDQHMEITGERKGLPVIRQLPGEWNELGKIKFLFPNSLNIYFHDTPHKWLFNKDQRAYSHGCIRLADAAKLAAFLLKDKPGWSEEQADSIMSSDNEKYIKLTRPVPVLIYYYTAWVDENGTLQFRKDIYGHDTAMSKRLF